MEVLLESLKAEWFRLLAVLPRLLVAAIAFLIIFWIGRLVGRGVAKVLERGKLTLTHRKFFRGLTAWVFALFGITVALNVLGLKTLAGSIVAGGGITAVVIGFAFREIGENFLAGFFLAFSRPFEIGDLIESGGYQGEVRGIELRFIHIRTVDGRDIFIPSSQIFKDPLVNFTRDGLRRLSFTVGIDYADDSDRAKEILLEAVRSTPGVLTEPKPAVTISELDAQFVKLEAFLWIDTFSTDASLLYTRTDAMGLCRKALLDAGFTVSSNVSTNLVLEGTKPLEVSLSK